MNIQKYDNETELEFLNRLLYCGVCEYIRLSILDRTNTDDLEIKSMIHTKLRGEEALNNFLNLFEECRDYFYNDNNKNRHPINIIRDRMIDSGELLKLKNGLVLPKRENILLNNNYSRITGLYTGSCKFTGITKIYKNDEIKNRYLSIDSSEIVDSIIRGLDWQICNNIDEYEIFNPRAKDSPSNSWDKKYCMSSNAVTIARIKVYEYVDDYYFIKKEKNVFYVSKISEHLCKFNEIRRIISILRYLHDNPLIAVSKRKSNVILLDLYFALPLREKILLETYCWPKRNVSDSFSYVVPIEAWELVKQCLIDMKIEIKEQ